MFKIKNFVIGIAIMILTSFVAIYGIQTFYQDEPLWENYCGNVSAPPYEINMTQTQCEAMGGKWNPTYPDRYAAPIPAKPTTGGYCDYYYECNKKLQEDQKIFSKNVFLISVPVGVVLIVIGAALFGLESVGAGIMLGGIITLIYGASKYWPSAGNAFKFGISLAGLIIVIILAYWLNKKISEKENKGKWNSFVDKFKRK